MELLFWLSLFAVIYPYALYPVLLVAWNRLTGRRTPVPDLARRPSVTVILPVHNEAQRVEAKVKNLLELDYPDDRLQVVIIGDGCTDDTLERAAQAGGSFVVVHPLQARAGKAAALNAGLELATGEIVVFTDAGILLERDALASLVGHFSDPAVGCVSGEDYVEGGGNEGLYGRMELFVRREEARLHSIAGASGCFYGMRRALCRPFRAGMAPDFLSVLDTVRSGHRAVCEPAARGAMTATTSQRAEFSRKTRTFLRGLTALFGNAALLNPMRYPAFSFILWSHKLMRWLGPVSLLLCLVAAYALRNEPLYAVLFSGQVAFYALALGALAWPAGVGRLALARISGFFLLVNAAAGLALLQWIAGVRQELWEPTKRPDIQRPCQTARPIRVLRLRDSPWLDGPGRTILETAARVDPALIQYRIGLLVPKGEVQHPIAQAARDRGIRFELLPDRGGFDLHLIRELRRLVADEQIDVVHSSDPRTDMLAAAAFLIASRPKLVATTHGWIANTCRRGLIRLLDKFALRRFDKVVVVSRSMLDLLPTWWIPRSRLAVVHNALAVESYGAGVRRDRDSGSGKNLRVLSVGRLSPEKAFDVVLQALADLNEEKHAFELTIAGQGPLEGRLREQARALGIANRVTFLGHVDDMPSVYASSDVVVQSSLTEGMPNVLLEASFMGIPVIATDVGGSRELIEDGISGVLVRPGSSAEIARALCRFADERRMFEEMADRARVRVLSEFTIDVRTQKLSRLYLELFDP